MDMTIVKCCGSFYEMHMLAIANRYCWTSNNSDSMKMIEEVCIRSNYMHMTISSRYRLSSHSSKTVIMSILPFFCKLCAPQKLMNMSLDLRCTSVF